jgi:hypothetical protein
MRGTWLQAADDFGFEFVTPFIAHVAGDRVESFGLLPEFGAEQGMVVLLECDQAKCDALVESGYGYSCPSLSDEPYDRESFIELLSDWGWSLRTRPAPAWLQASGV